MTQDERDRRRRRRLLFFLLFVAVLAYPALLLGSSSVGSSVGLTHDVNATRALARALNYAADSGYPVEPGNDGQLITVALDPNLVAQQLAQRAAAAPSPQALLGGSGTAAPDPSAAPAAPTGAPGTGDGGGAPPGGGNGGGAAPPPPVTPAPTSTPTAPPPPPPPPPPTPGPTSCAAGAPGVSVAGRVRDSQNNNQPVLLATVTAKCKGVAVGSGTTGSNGKYSISGLAPGTAYTFSISAPLYKPLDCGPHTPGSGGLSNLDFSISPVLSGNNNGGGCP